MESMERKQAGQESKSDESLALEDLGLSRKGETQASFRNWSKGGWNEYYILEGSVSHINCGIGPARQ